MTVDTVFYITIGIYILVYILSEPVAPDDE
jgi:hypothetical protein